MLFEKENQSSLYVNKITTFYNWRKQWDNSKSVKPLKKTGRKLILDQDKN